MTADPRSRDDDPGLDERLQKLYWPERLEALDQSGLLDSDPEPAFDRLTDCAARLVDAPVALVSLVDRDRQFFKSCTGLSPGTRETPLSHSFCRLVTSGHPLIVEDARNHPLVQDNPAIEELDVEAYLGYPLTTRSGHVLGSFCVIDRRPRPWSPEDRRNIQDLAAFASAEIQLRLALAVAEQRTREEQKATRRLRKAERTLLNTLRRREEILGIVAHDLRDPLNTIKLTSSLIRKATDDAAQHVEKIDRAVDTMNGLLGDLIHITREDAHDLLHEPEPQDVATLISRAVDAFEDLAERRGLELGRETTQHPLTVHADPFRIQQVLANLLSNALRHTPPPGEIRIGASRDEEAEQVRIWVRDSGRGIDPAHLPYVFEPFRQGPKEESGQSGLGLAIVRKIVETHGGRVGIDSTVGVGTTCWFTLPQA